MRFLVFGLAAIIAIGGLTTRLFYLQIVSGGEFAALSEGNRTALQAIPSSQASFSGKRTSRTGS
jgi:cell division protein FtsI/penicillin-binding protein 2